MAAAKTPASADRPARKTAARHQRVVIATPDEAGQLKIEPGDEAAQRAVKRVKARATRGKSPSRRTAVDRLDDPPPVAGAALIERVSRAVERELLQIEVIVGGHHVPPRQRTEAERRARTLASLARTLGELKRLRAEEQKEKPDHDDMPRDLDDFRRELSRRLEQVVRGRETVPSGGDE